MKSAGSNLLFAVLTEISDNILKGAESNGVDGMVSLAQSLLLLMNQLAYYLASVLKLKYGWYLSR